MLGLLASELRQGLGVRYARAAPVTYKCWRHEGVDAVLARSALSCDQGQGVGPPVYDISFLHK